MFTDPRVFKRAMDNAFGTVQVGGPRKELSQEKYREYLELGIVNTNVRLGDLRNLLKDVRFGEGNFATDSILFPMIKDKKVSGYLENKFFIDIGTPLDYKLAQNIIPEHFKNRGY